jgi:murein DD-endopeptidase MepM/ murein hydrolase activator NlpD
VLYRFPRYPLAGLADPARIDVIRHRLAPRLDRRRRSLLVAAGVLALVGLGSLADNAAGPDPDPAPSTAAVSVGDPPALADRAARAELADRKVSADRSERPPADEPVAPRAAAPEASPEPEPSPTEAAAETRTEAEEREPEPEPEETPEQAAAAADWVHPIPGASTSSCYGSRWGRLHAGVDLAAPHGTPIRAAGAGTVTDAGWVFGGYGISVVVDHHNGYLTHYAHASEVKVSPGQGVSAGETIALEGSTGNSTGPHLHFEVHQGMWNQIEPTAWLRGQGVDIGGC